MNLQAFQHPAGQLFIEGRQLQSLVPEELGIDATHASHQNRPKHGVLLDAQDQLHAVFGVDHGLYGHTLDPGLGIVGPGVGDDLVKCFPHSGFSADVQHHSPGISLMRNIGG